MRASSKLQMEQLKESLYYGDILKFNVATSKEANNELLKLLLPIRKKGKPNLCYKLWKR